MSINTPLPPAVKELLTSRKTMTITKRVKITNHIIDSVFMASTPQAAHLYGYKEPNDLIGKWLSQTHSRDIARRCFVVAYYRHTGQKIGGMFAPSTYVTLVTLPDGSTKEVVKRAQELIWEGEIYWVTEIEEAKGETSMPNILDFDIPSTQPDFNAWSGVWTISDIESQITEKLLTAPMMTSKIDCVNIKMTPSKSNMRREDYTQHIPLQTSTTGRVQRPHYLHRCAECSGTWVGITEKPSQCIYCSSRLWRGFSKWEERRQNMDK